MKTHSLVILVRTTSIRNKSIDIKGAITFSITVISFLITLQFLEKAGSNDLIQIIMFSVASIVSLFLFIAIEKRAPFPLIDFKLLKNKTILSANIISMTVGLTTLMVVYQSLPILIRSPPPIGFGGDASSVAYIQLSLWRGSKCESNRKIARRIRDGSDA
jgi:hypothetical protein